MCVRVFLIEQRDSESTTTSTAQLHSKHLADHRGWKAHKQVEREAAIVRMASIDADDAGDNSSGRVWCNDFGYR